MAVVGLMLKGNNELGSSYINHTNLNMVPRECFAYKELAISHSVGQQIRAKLYLRL